MGYAVTSDEWLWDVMEDIHAPLQGGTEHGKNMPALFVDQEQYSCCPLTASASSRPDHGVGREKEAVKWSKTLCSETYAPRESLHSKQSSRKSTNSMKRHGKARALLQVGVKARNDRIGGIKKKKRAKNVLNERRLLEEMEALVYSGETDFAQLC
ncbi:hypothetical protein FGB62_107g05 [Gracilaria domingensis]|nr:hypothetical protein FGB62_107g05 [Gracilaria domingensis]